MSAQQVQKELPIGLSLEPDYITIPGQNYALVSFVGPEHSTCRQKSANGKFAMKIRGVFATQEEAATYVKRLQRSGDNIVDIFLVSLYNWVPCPPNPMEVESQEYQEQFLQELMQGYAESQRSAKEMFNDRKEKVMADGLDAHLTPEERIAPNKGKQPVQETIKESIVDVTEADEAGPSASSATDGIFESDVWMNRNKQ